MMKSRHLVLFALSALGVLAVRAQNGPAYSTPDLILVFENPTGTDLEFNLDPITNLPTSGTVDFGNFSSILTGNGQTVSTTLWSVVADAGGVTKGAPGGGYPLAVNTSSGAVNALPGAIWLTQNNASTPGALTSLLPAATLTSVNDSISAVGTDISTNAAISSSGLGSKGVAVSATGDSNSYTSQGSYGNLSSNLEVTGSGKSQLWLATSTAPGTGSAKSAVNEGPLAEGFDLGSFSLSASGELTFTAAPSSSGPPPPTSGRIVDLSARANVGTGGNILIAGFVIGGSGTKNVLLRGVGPTLGSAFAVPGSLAQPDLTLLSNAGDTLASNAGWGGGATLSDAFAQVGAFALPAASLDSALLTSLPAGPYTAQVTGAGGTSGVALAEIYDADSGPPTASLVNISARAYVGTGANVLIAGFVIEGGQPVQLLLRGIGPSLADFGVPSPVAGASIVLNDSTGTPMQSDSGWGNGLQAGTSGVSATFRNATAADMTAVGAFALIVGTADSAMVATLPAGNYTLELTGTSGSAGVGLIEVYLMP
jgi:hypothetical protein